MPLIKTRLTGFVTLGALAAILVPMLFDGQGVRESRLQVQIPDTPPFPVMQTVAPQQPLLVDTRAFAEPVPERIEARQPRMSLSSDQPLSAAVEAEGAAVEAEGAPVSVAPTPAALTLEREVPRLDAQGVPVAWTLQLAAFKERGNAEGLRDRLLKAGYKAYVREKNALTRVFVGPEVQRSQLEQLKVQFQREMKLDGLILRFTTG